MLLSLLLNGLGKLKRTQRMDHHRLVDDIFNLVSLKVPDHMPAEVFGKNLIFISQLLRFVFTEIDDSLRHGFLDHGSRLCLADRNQCHLAATPSSPVTGSLYPLFNTLQIFLDHDYPPCMNPVSEVSGNDFIFLHLGSIQCNPVVCGKPIGILGIDNAEFFILVDNIHLAKYRVSLVDVVNALDRLLHIV